MKRAKILLIFLTMLCPPMSAQTGDVPFMIIQVQPNTVKINGSFAERFQHISSRDTITWESTNDFMIIMPLEDYPYTDIYGEQCTWYANVTSQVSAQDETGYKPEFLWWIKYNKSSAKGSEYSFDNTFYMFDNKLIIQRPYVLKINKGYEFVSLSNGKSFNSANEDSKPLIMITRNKLDSIGFDGESIILRVIHHEINNKIDCTTVVAESMRIINIR